MMQVFGILLLLTFSCFTNGASIKRQIQQTHAGYCPMHVMICAIYCPPTTINVINPQQIGACRADSDCASNEKCCAPACGCTNRCTKAVEKPGFQTFP